MLWGDAFQRMAKRRGCDGGLGSTNVSVGRLWFSSDRSRWWLVTSASTKDACGGGGVTSCRGTTTPQLLLSLGACHGILMCECGRSPGTKKGPLSPSDGRRWKTDTSSCAEGVGTGDFGATGVGVGGLLVQPHWKAIREQILKF